MLVHAVTADFVAYTNHNMTNFIVIKLMEKCNAPQRMALVAAFEAH